MKTRLRAATAFVVLVGVSLVAADPSYVGKWKLNTAKSQLTGDTVTISKATDGMMTFDGQGFKYSFKADGKEYPTPDGATASWTQASPDAYDVMIKGGGKAIATYHAVVKGEALDLAGKLSKADGTTSDFSVAYKRKSGGPGLAGTWTSTEVKAPISTLEVSAAAPDGVSITDDSGATFGGQFDGKETPALGRLKGSKITTIFKKTTANSFEVTNRVDGKAMSTEIYSVSADGKTLTIDGKPTNAPTEKYKVVFDRQ
jgi:hypothetical protein